MNAPQMPQHFVSAHGQTTRTLSNTALRALRDQLPVSQSGLGAFKPIVLKETPNEIVMAGESDDFETNWEYARTLYKADRPRDALAYILKANELEPTHPKAKAKLVEILLALHDEMPNVGYNYAAFGVASELSDIERSEFSQNLFEDAQTVMLESKLKDLRTTLGNQIA